MGLIQKMMAIAGRDPNGKARAIRTDEEGNVNVKLTGSNVGYSSEVKPAGKRGDTFLEIDTGNVYIHDGQKWVEL